EDEHRTDHVGDAAFDVAAGSRRQDTCQHRDLNSGPRCCPGFHPAASIDCADGRWIRGGCGRRSRPVSGVWPPVGRAATVVRGNPKTEEETPMSAATTVLDLIATGHDEAVAIAASGRPELTYAGLRRLV